MLFSCSQCGNTTVKRNLMILPKNEKVFKSWINQYNLKITKKKGDQYICKTHVTEKTEVKEEPPALDYNEPSTSDFHYKEPKQEEEEVFEEQKFQITLAKPKDEVDNELSYDDYPMKMEQDSYGGYEEVKNYDYQQNNFSMDSQPTTSRAATSSHRGVTRERVSESTDLANLPMCFPELSDDKIMSLCVKTSSNLSGESSFECGMCAEQYFETPDTRPIRLHLEMHHSIAVNTFIQTGQTEYAPKEYNPLSATSKENADEELCKFFIRNGLPLKTVHDPNLEMLVFNMNSSYKLPSIDKLSECLQNIALEKMNLKIKAENGPVTVSFDTTKFNNRHYLAFTVHYYGPNNQKKRTVFLREFNMTQSVVSSIMSTIKNTMDTCNIRLPITTVVAGQVEYEEALEKMGSFKNVLICFSDSLNKFAESLIKHPIFAVSLQKLREFISSFPTKRNDWSKFKSYIVRKRTYGEYPEVDNGHWFTTLDFITKCLHMHRLFSDFALTNANITYIDVVDNVNIVYLHSLLNLIKASLKTIAEPRSTIADIIPAVLEINESLCVTTSSQNVIDVVNMIFNRLLAPFVEQSDIHRFAVFLHPLRHGTAILPGSEWNAIGDSLARHLALRESADVTPIKNGRRKSSMPAYQNTVTADREVADFSAYVGRVEGVESEIVDWWARHSARFPRLNRIAKEIFQVPAFSINASFYLGEYGVLTHSVNETEVSKTRMLLEASSELVEFRSKGEIIAKPICVKRKRDTANNEEMWYNPIDTKALLACEPGVVDSVVGRRQQMQKRPNVPLSSAALSNNRIYLSSRYPQMKFNYGSPNAPLRNRPGLAWDLTRHSLHRPIHSSSPYARPIVIKREPASFAPIKREIGTMNVPTATKKYVAVKSIPSNGTRMIRTMNGQIIQVANKPQYPVATIPITNGVANTQGKKIYFVRSKTGVTHRLQVPPPQ